MWRWLALLLLTGLIAGAACGDDGDGGDGTESDARPLATQAPDFPPPPVEADCDPSYPNVCIPSFPPDLDCGEITHRRFKVLPPDPHGFDRDQDGVGCESG